MSERKHMRTAPKGVRWISKQEVRHWRSGRMMKRRDGKPFRFRIR
jgi:hypothetical protein